MNTKSQIRADKKLLTDLGGSTKVAEMLGLDKTKGGVQRVQNWMVRGISDNARLKWPDILQPSRPKSQPSIPGAPIDGKKLREAKNGTHKIPPDTTNLRQ